jgi:hypothetical protein
VNVVDASGQLGDLDTESALRVADVGGSSANVGGMHMHLALLLDGDVLRKEREERKTKRLNSVFHLLIGTRDARNVDVLQLVHQQADEDILDGAESLNLKSRLTSVIEEKITHQSLNIRLELSGYRIRADGKENLTSLTEGVGGVLVHLHLLHERAATKKKILHASVILQHIRVVKGLQNVRAKLTKVSTKVLVLADEHDHLTGVIEERSEALATSELLDK